MKKILLSVLALVIIVILSLLIFLRSSSGYRSIYFVPSDAVTIIETNDPVKAWDDILHSKAWEHFSSNELFKELNNDLQSYDSLINSSKILLNLIGQKKITISQHLIAENKYEYIYIVDVGNMGKLKNPEKLFSSILGKNYNVTSRKYNNISIVELYDKANSSNYFVACSEGKIIFSFNPKLVEKSLDASIDKAIGLDSKYLAVQSKITNKGLFSVYLNFKNLGTLVNSLSAEATENYIKNTQYLSYTGFVFNIDKEGMITMENYTSFKDNTPISYLDMFSNGKTDIQSINVIPQRLASLAKINFSSASEYFDNAMLSSGEKEYDTYKANISKLEKKLKINLEENLFSWMDKEIVVLQTQPSNLGRDNELAVILHANDSAKAAENLHFMWKQIKKNTPIKIKSIPYKNYNIDYIAFPGIIKTLFGKTLQKLEKPYFTQIGEDVILSNHPQTLKNLVDDYLNQKSLSSSVSYYNFRKHFNNQSSAFIYFEPPVLFYNLKAFVDTKTWDNLTRNKKFITCFNQGGLQINKLGDVLHIMFKIQYQPESSEWKRQHYDYSEINSLFSSEEPDNVTVLIESKLQIDTIPTIIITDLDAKTHKEYFKDGSLKLEVELKNGLKDGDMREYHQNGKVKIKGEFDKDIPIGKWKYYNEDGDLIKVDKY